MKALVVASRLVFFGTLLFGQNPMYLGGREDLLHEQRVIRHDPTALGYVVVPSLPAISPALPLDGKLQLGWDGKTAYQMGIQQNGRVTLSSGIPSKSATGEDVWFWSPATTLALQKEANRDFTLLGVRQDCLLVLQHQLEKEKGNPLDQGVPSGGGKTTQQLLQVDLITGKITELFSISSNSVARSTAIFHSDSFYIFSASGNAIRVKTESIPWQATSLTENYWKTLEIRLRSKTDGRLNPTIFGNAFFDDDNSILIPIQADFAFTPTEISQFWASLSPEDRTTAIKDGHWPPVPGVEFGWRCDVLFIRFDPTSSSFSRLDSGRFAHLTLDEPRDSIPNRRLNRFNREFRFITRSGRIEVLDEAALTGQTARSSNDKSVPSNPVLKAE